MTTQILIRGLLLAILAPLAVESAAQQPRERVYVAEFVMRNRNQNELTENLTREFENALASISSRYQLLERASVDRLRQHFKNEEALGHPGGLPNALTSELRLLKADKIVFGEIHHDAISGEYSVTVSFLKPTGEKDIGGYILIRQGLISDGASRRRSMEELVRTFEPVVETKSGVRSGALAAEISAEIARLRASISADEEELDLIRRRQERHQQDSQQRWQLTNRLEQEVQRATSPAEKQRIRSQIAQIRAGAFGGLGGAYQSIEHLQKDVERRPALEAKLSRERRLLVELQEALKKGGH